MNYAIFYSMKLKQETKGIPITFFVFSDTINNNLIEQHPNSRKTPNKINQIQSKTI